jgi:hypothetical protein
MKKAAKKSKPKEKPLKLNMSFEEAIKLAVNTPLKKSAIPKKK